MRVIKFSSIYLCLGMAVSFACDGGALKPVLKEEIKNKFQQITGGDPALEAWIGDAEKEAKDLVKTVKDEEAISRAGAALVSVEVSAQIIEGASVDIEKLLNSVSDKGWSESVAALRKLLTDKNLFLSDLSRNPKLVKSFVSTLVEAEKKYRKEKAKIEKAEAPITETKPAAYTPSGTLGQGLRLLKVLSSFVDESVVSSIEVDTEATLVKKFLSRD